VLNSAVYRWILVKRFGKARRAEVRVPTSRKPGLG